MNRLEAAWVAVHEHTPEGWYGPLLGVPGHALEGIAARCTLTAEGPREAAWRTAPD